MRRAEAGGVVGTEDAVRVLGVDFLDWTMPQALERIAAELERSSGPARAVYFVNAATLNLATERPEYRAVLNEGDYVFGDGTGVRMGARMLHGVHLRDNVNGTDLTPALLSSNVGKGLRYFLLGATPEAIERAARRARELFPHWVQAGHHHGYLNDPAVNEAALAKVNASGSHLLLVGMGNPLQETWIHNHRDRLDVRVAMGIGGLFTYWSGDLDRAPEWMRKIGQEWLHILLSQPHKAGRYLKGNPLFLARVMKERVLGAR